MGCMGGRRQRGSRSLSWFRVGGRVCVCGGGGQEG